MRREHLQERISRSASLLSLDAPVDDEPKSRALGEFIASSAQSQEDAAEDMLVARHVREGLRRLRPREEKVLRLRFAIGEPYNHTLEEVGEKLGLRASESARLKQRRCALCVNARKKCFLKYKGIAAAVPFDMCKLGSFLLYLNK